MIEQINDRTNVEENIDKEGDYIKENLRGKGIVRKLEERNVCRNRL
jgi:predicted GNAT family acetyltransferase